MKLVCPNCISHLKIPTNKVPAEGGWARCPKCSEKFFIQAQGKNLSLLFEPPKAPLPRQRIVRDETRQELLDHLKVKRGEEVGQDRQQFDPAIDRITIFPQPALSPETCQIIGIVLLTLPLFALAILFYTLKYEPPPPAPVAEFKKMLNNEFNIQLIRSDLLQIRRQTNSRKRLLMEIDFTGSESRVFKYFAKNMVPEVCDAITWLEIKSDLPAKGFQATAVCEGSILQNLEMQVRWTDKTAIISFPGYSKQSEEVDLFPSNL